MVDTPNGSVWRFIDLMRGSLSRRELKKTLKHSFISASLGLSATGHCACVMKKFSIRMVLEGVRSRTTFG